MKLLVTGGARYIRSVVAAQLVEAGHDTVVLDNLSKGYEKAVPEGTRFVRVYNLGNGAGFSVREVIEAARRVTGRPIEAVESPRRPGDPAVLVASSDRIQAELGWKPEEPELEAMISDAWDWMQAHPNGYE